jgi:hypothetical protein
MGSTDRKINSVSRKKGKAGRPRNVRNTRVNYRVANSHAVQRENTLLRRMLEWCVFNLTSDAKDSPRYQHVQRVLEGHSPYRDKTGDEYGWY